MTDIWFIRHGESLSNAGHVVERTDICPLTEKGHQQSLALSKVFTRAPDLVVVTPYLRTQQTAAPTLARFPHIRREVWPLQEFACLDFAKYNNTNILQRVPFVKEYWARNDPNYVDGAGAESFNAMIRRVRDALERLQAREEKFIAIFAHGHIMRTLRFLLQRPEFSTSKLMSLFPDYAARTVIENCSIIRVISDTQGLRLSHEDQRLFEEGFDDSQRAVFSSQKAGDY